MEEKLSAELETERQRVLGLKQEKSSMESSYDERIAKLEKDHGKELSELESVYKAKITAEIQRYDTLVKERETMNAEWDKRNASTVASHEKHVEEMKKDYEKKLDDEEVCRRMCLWPFIGLPSYVPLCWLLLLLFTEAPHKIGGRIEKP